MTEHEWLECDDPRPMLRYLIGTDEPRVQAVEEFPNARGSDRKLRLFACACYDRVSRFLPDQVARDTVRVAARFADGAVSVTELRKAEAAVLELVAALEPRWRASDGAERAALYPTHAALALAGIVCWREPQKAAWYAASNAHLERPYLADAGVDVHSAQRWEGQAAEMRAQCKLLHCVFGNPFRPASIDQQHLAVPVTALAQAIYDERAFDRIPILADALEDAGCTDPDILAHCRGGGEHVRGCWVVDLLTGKE